MELSAGGSPTLLGFLTSLCRVQGFTFSIHPMAIAAIQRTIIGLHILETIKSPM